MKACSGLKRCDCPKGYPRERVWPYGGQDAERWEWAIRGRVVYVKERVHASPCPRHDEFVEFITK